MARKLTEEDARNALHDHLINIGQAARNKYGPHIDLNTMFRILDDRAIVRYAVGLRFDSEPLRPGEFAFAQRLGERSQDGYCLFVHPCFENQPEILPLLIAYHIVDINYGDLSTSADAEIFGATLLGMDVEEYYLALCAAADSIPPSGGMNDEI